jgi:hypothetical protein
LNGFSRIILIEFVFEVFRKLKSNHAPITPGKYQWFTFKKAAKMLITSATAPIIPKVLFVIFIIIYNKLLYLNVRIDKLLNGFSSDFLVLACARANFELNYTQKNG